MLNNEEILGRLEGIVGKGFVSNKPEERFIYARDPGASKPRSVDFVVMPRSTEEVQEIVRLANQVKMPVVPMGGGLTLSGLTIPVKAGLVMDLKRMDRILEVNEVSRYALIEAGVTTGKLLSHLKRHHPGLEPPLPDAPPSVTVAGNVLIHGSGYLSQRYGEYASMVNGLEVVLPSGEVARLGSCAVSGSWFARGPIPDLIGLFQSSFGTMGVVTKLAIQLFPRPAVREVVFGLLSDPKLIPGLALNLSASNLVEDVLLGMQDKPDWMKGNIFVMAYVTGDSEESVKQQVKSLKRVFRESQATHMEAPGKLRAVYLEKPIFASSTADFRKGGGFEYVGAHIPLEKIPDAYNIGAEISRRHGIPATLGSRMISGTHNIVMFFSYSFNRADPADVENAREALDETNRVVLELGGIPWKGELGAQKLLLGKMDPTYKKLLRSIRNLLDPNKIMNPGNWEEDD
ncbi:MAG: FAD-binding oxidoreductase [Candidatus Lokiarchaeota archaeon]|nr:FAD-binding oxidoreductase [Candidatus Lokiarchaeota archaeon]